MDSFPAQAIQPVPVQQAEPLVQSPIQKLPQKKVNLKKLLNLGTWVVLFALLPIAVLIFLSQDSIPGDLFYPVKRGMENVILAAASVSPVTKAAFRTDLTEARFKEAQSLIIAKANASGLASFTDDVQAVQLEVASLTNDAERTKAEDKLLVKIDQYQNSLSNLQAKTEQNLIAYSAQETPTPTPPPAKSNLAPAEGSTNTVSNQNRTSPTLPSLTPTLTSAIMPTIISAKISITTPTSLPSPTSQPKLSPTSPPAKSDLIPAGGSSPTPIPILTLTPTTAPTLPIQQENIQVAQQEKIAQTLKDTKEKLDKIKKDLGEKRNENRGENTRRSAENNASETQNQR